MKSIDRSANLGRLWLIAWLVVAVALVGRSLWLWGDRADEVASRAPASDASLNPASFERAAPPVVRRLKPIEELRVGDRVISDNPDVAADDKLGGRTRVDPATWRMLTLYGEETWPDGTLDTIYIQTLQPPEWIELWGAEVGARVPPPLDLQEMGLREDLLVRVTANHPCPELAAPLNADGHGDDPGRLVLTTVNHLNPDVWELTVEPIRGPPSAGSSAPDSAASQTLKPTGFHKFYSETRSAWVSTNELEPSEVIRGRAGPLRVTDAWPTPGAQRVYNLTVEGEHVYFVGESGVLAHNNGCRREEIIRRLGEIAQPHLDEIRKIVPDAQVGFRGSLASGIKRAKKREGIVALLTPMTLM